LHTSCYPTLQHHNSYNRTDNYRQWNAVGSPDDGHKDAQNTLRYCWLPINHYLLHPVGLTFTYYLLKIWWWEVRTEGWAHHHSPSKFCDDLIGQHIGVWPSIIEEKNFHFSCGTTCLHWWTGHGIIHFMLWKDHCISVYQPGRHCHTFQ